MVFRTRKPSGPDVSGDVRAPVGSWTFSPARPFMRPRSCYRQRRSSTACLVFQCHWLGTSTAAANVSISTISESGQRCTFQWLEIEGRYHPSRGRQHHQVLFDDIGSGSPPRIRPKTYGDCCGVSSSLPRASLSPRKHLLGSSNSFSDGSSREARSPKQCSPVTRHSSVPVISSICANLPIQRLAISINMPSPRDCRIS